MEKIQAEQVKKEELGYDTKLKEKFSQTLEGEQKKGELSPMSIDIFYSIHKTEEDIKKLAERFKKCDVYIPEGLGWGKNILKIFRGISSGIFVPEQALSALNIEKSHPYYGFSLGIFNLIYNSKKPIIFIDVPYDDPLIKRLNKYKYFKLTFEENFEETILSFRDFSKSYNKVQEEREKYMLSSLKEKIEELSEDYPELKEKAKLKILLSIGAFHSPLYFDFKKTEKNVERKFSHSPFIFGFQEEGARRERFGKDMNDEFIARILIDKILDSVIGPILIKSATLDSHRIYKFQRYVVSRFNIKEIKEFYEELREIKKTQENKERKVEKFFGILLKWFRKKNIKFPRTEKELDEILNRR